MRFRSLSVGVVLAALFAMPVQAQTTLNFDDLTGAACAGVQGGMGVYQGVDFLGQWSCYSDPQDPYNAASGTNRLYTAGTDGYHSSGSFSFAGPVQFLGASFSGYGFESVTFDLYLASTLVHTSSSLTMSSTPTFLASGYTGAVDRVTVRGVDPQYPFFVMDDVQYASVPEPASFVLVASGLAGLAAVKRRRRTI